MMRVTVARRIERAIQSPPGSSLPPSFVTLISNEPPVHAAPRFMPHLVPKSCAAE